MNGHIFTITHVKILQSLSNLNSASYYDVMSRLVKYDITPDPIIKCCYKNTCFWISLCTKALAKISPRTQSQIKKVIFLWDIRIVKVLVYLRKATRKNYISLQHKCTIKCFRYDSFALIKNCFSSYSDSKTDIYIYIYIYIYIILVRFD